MKLFYFPGACSLSVHIALEESGLPFEVMKVDYGNPDIVKELARHNPLLQVPTLLMKDGGVLTENAAILPYVASQVPEKKLMPEPNSRPWFQAMEALSFVSTELHKGAFSIIFASDSMTKNKEAEAEIDAFAKTALSERLALLEKRFTQQDWMLPWGFTVADCYLFTVLNWSGMMGVDLAPFPKVREYQARVGARPAAQRAMRTQGLIK